ncbi:unnamed protein product [Psylliodes chrysocephalus]|uniref:Uncharacterized protein n=1 Tax=Psylliodes chrysocephalus TaxID=3402493 RepID=A0A9P0G7H8_9CUCU|nr:unnamed protein product [Psylliodes chrysocephala]
MHIVFWLTRAVISEAKNNFRSEYVSSMKKENEIREEFLGFVEMKQMVALSIALMFKTFFKAVRDDLYKSVGQRNDGCSTMADKGLRDYFLKEFIFTVQVTNLSK